METYKVKSAKYSSFKFSIIKFKELKTKTFKPDICPVYFAWFLIN